MLNCLCGPNNIISNMLYVNMNLINLCKKLKKGLPQIGALKSNTHLKTKLSFSKEIV